MKIRFGLTIVIFAALAGFDLSSATPARAADAWGCSYDKCVAYCAKVGGQRCSTYCTKKLQEKQLTKVCPAS